MQQDNTRGFRAVNRDLRSEKVTALCILLCLVGCASQSHVNTHSKLSVCSPVVAEAFWDNDDNGISLSVSIGDKPLHVPHNEMLTLTITNIGQKAWVYPDQDIDGHLSVFVELKDAAGVSVPLTRQGHIYFDSLSGGFIRPIEVGVGKSRSWTVDLQKAFAVKPGHPYTVSARFLAMSPQKMSAVTVLVHGLTVWDQKSNTQ